MMSKSIKRSLLAFALAIMAGLAGKTEAAFVTYTETATGSGTLGTTTFTNAALTFTQTADTANVIYVFNGDPRSGSYSYMVGDATATVTIAGVGTASFTGPTFTTDSPTGRFGGLGSGGPVFGGNIILDVGSPVFANYNLQSSFGPASGDPGITTSNIFSINYATNLGDLALNSVTGQATFQASVVPEPSSLTLGTIAALVGLGVRARRRALVA